MNVYHLSAVLVRIAGIVLTVMGLQQGISWFAIASSGAYSDVAWSYPDAWMPLTVFVMWLTAGLIMLIFPGQVAGNLMPASGPGTSAIDEIPNDNLTRLILLGGGLYFTIQGAVSLTYLIVYWIYYFFESAKLNVSWLPFWNAGLVGRAASGLVELGAGLVLLFRTHGIGALFSKLRRASPRL